MSENNPMLEQLKAALENPHFAALAEKVAKEMLGASFKGSMNAHPDVATVEGRWLGTLKRLVCNTILTTYNEAMAGRFNAAHWARAEAEMEEYHSQVQGFVYEHTETGGNLHVIRDLTLPRDQVIWEMLEDQRVVKRSREDAEAEYARCHALMMRAIRERQISMTWTHYLWAVTSGAYNEEKVNG